MDHIPDDVIEAARLLNMRLHSATELGQRTQWIAEALMKEREHSRQLLSEAEAALDEREIASGLTSNGNLWRFWAEKAKDMAVKLLSDAEKREREARAKALEEAAQVADDMPKFLVKSPVHVEITSPKDVAERIRALQSEERG